MNRHINDIYSIYLIEQYKKIEIDITENNNWSILEDYIQRSVYTELLESFDLIKTEESPTKIEHSYKVVTKNKKTFNVLLTYINQNESYDILNKREREYQLKNNNILKDNYGILKKLIQETNKKICVLMFSDENKSTKLTGKTGTISGLELFRTLNDVVHDSFDKINYNVGVVCIRIDNHEKQKRLPFYQYIHKKYWSHIFPNVFVDEQSENQYDFTLLYLY